jgi:hypothetical protein
MCVLLVAALMPLLIVSRYNVPSADDYTHGVAGYENWNEHHSLTRLIGASAQYSGNIRRLFTGLYSIGLITFTMPFFVNNYWVIPFISLVPLCLCAGFLVFSVFRKFFRADFWLCLFLAAASAICVIQFVPSPAESYYWHSAATTYTGATALLFLILGLTVWLCFAKSRAFKIFYAVFCPLAAVFCGGANFVTALAGAEIFILVTLALAIAKNKVWRLVCVPALFSCASFAFAVSAPGNAARLSSVTQAGDAPPSAVSAVFNALDYGGRYARLHSSPFLWLALAFMLPFFVKAARTVSFRFRFPAAVTALSWLLFSSLSCPSFYALDRAGDARVLGVYSMFFVLFAVFNTFYWTGWAARHFLKPDAIGLFRRLALPGLCAFALLFALLTASFYREGALYKLASASAAADLASGRAARYHDEYLARREVLEDADTTDPVFAPYSVKPRTLFFNDIQTDPALWTNAGLANFYGKNSVRLDRPQS